jgi:hypothetical protein
MKRALGGISEGHVDRLPLAGVSALAELVPLGDGQQFVTNGRIR